MKVAVFGMGHVGLVTAALLAEVGHTVIGVDVDRDRLTMLGLGCLPFEEPGLLSTVKRSLRTGNLSFSTDGAEAARDSDVSLICVGTPTTPEGLADLSAVYAVLDSIASALARSERYHVVALRSTVPPMAIEPMAEYFAFKVGHPVDLVASPEFLREGVAVADFRYPVLVVVGGDAARAIELVVDLYRPFGREEVVIARTDGKTAMLVKYVSNAWHALKVAFANEIGDVAREVGVDGQELMHIFAQDTTLNISTAYLRPGAPYGGSCLPKDLAALLTMTESALPLLRSVKESNALRIQRLFQDALHARSVGLVGLSFKRGTDDLRDSPWVEVLRMLAAAGVAVRVYDPDVSYAAAGEYRAYWRENFDELEGWAECLIVGKPDLLPPDARLPERVIYGDGR